MLRAILTMLVFVPGVAAAEVIGFGDPAGDVALSNTVSVPSPFDLGVDIAYAALHETQGGFQAVITLYDLESMHNTDVGVFPDTMFGLRWALGDGTWTARADYQPMNPEPWSFWAEGPCLDGNDHDGCAGQDRDIHDGLDGSIDMEAGTVTINLPRDLFTGTSSADFHGFDAFTDAVWPAYPVYIGDRAAPEPAEPAAQASASPLAAFMDLGMLALVGAVRFRP